MNKAEYMKKLQEKLEQFNQGLQEEILEDYERHFAEAQAMGKSEEEIIEELGNIEDMIQEFSEEDYKKEVIPADAVCEAFGEQAYSGTYKAIVLDGVMADIVLEESKDENLYIHFENEDEMFKQIYFFYQYEENGVFYAGIRHREGAELSGTKRIALFGKTIFSFQNMGMRWGSAVITVQVPKGFPRVQARTLSGDMELSDLSVEELQLSTTSGDLTLKRVETGELTVQTASGDVELAEVAAKSSVMKTGSGNIDVRTVRGESITVGTGSGDVELRADAETYALRTGSGDVSAEVSGKARSIAMSTGSGDATLNMKAVEGAEVKVSVGSGDIHITGSNVSRHGGRSCLHTYGDAACKVKVSTGSGDVDVKCR